VGFFHRAGSTQPQLGSIAQLENGGVDMLPSYGTGPVTATQTGLTLAMSGTSSELGLLILTYLRRGAALTSVMRQPLLKLALSHSDCLAPLQSESGPFWTFTALVPRVA